MPADIHFVQGSESPVLDGAGPDTLCCACGNILISGYAPVRFLAIGIQCARCSQVTTTPPLPDGSARPASVIIAAPSATPRADAMVVPADVAVIGQAEVERLRSLYQPVTPAGTTYHVTAELLDEVVTTHDRVVGEALSESALGSAAAVLRGRVGDEGWTCTDDANAVTVVAGFLHFVATWSHHPLFPVMAATAAERGFSLHALAPFAAAHMIALSGQPVNFPRPAGYPERIEGFDIGASSVGPVVVHTEAFERSDVSAVSEVVAASQGRINLRHPGMLVLSPGNAVAGFDAALVEAVKGAVQALGRKHRGLLAVSTIMLRIQATPDPHTVRFGYGWFPVQNRHFSV